MEAGFKAFPDYASKTGIYGSLLLAILFLRQRKNAQIMLDSQNNVTLVPENAFFLNIQAKRNSRHMCLPLTE